MTNFYYVILVAGIFLALTGPPLFSDGMFLDGIERAIVARNLAEGAGTFWSPYYSESTPVYSEHPPLAFGLQGLFFHVFGDSLLVERFYSLMTFVITAFLIARIWYAASEKPFRQLYWLPLLLWVLMPKVSWSYANNMLENTLAIFSTASVLLVIKSLHGRRLVYICLAGNCIYLAFLSKGPIALFPWSAFLWVLICFRSISFKQFLIDTMLLVFFTILPFIVIFLIQPESIESMQRYFNDQVLYSLTEDRTVDTRFYILGCLLEQLVVYFAIFLAIYLAALMRRHKTGSSLAYRQPRLWFFLFLGLAGVVPIMISMKQKAVYIFPVLPYFALAFAELLAPLALVLSDKIHKSASWSRWFKISCAAILIAGLIPTIYYFGKPRRQTELISDVQSIMKIVPKGATVGTCRGRSRDSYPHAYFARYGKISIDDYNETMHQFLLVNRKKCVDFSPGPYEKVQIETHILTLYRKNRER